MLKLQSLFLSTNKLNNSALRQLCKIYLPNLKILDLRK